MAITIDFVFNVINLAARIGLVVYLVNRYVISSVVHGIKSEKLALASLKQQQLELRESCSQVEAQIKDDQEHFDTMQKKFYLWHDKVALAVAQEQDLCKQRQQKMDDMLQKRMNYLQQRQQIEAHVPLLLDQVHDQMEKEFKQNQTLGKNYQNKVLETLLKDS